MSGRIGHESVDPVQIAISLQLKHIEAFVFNKSQYAYVELSRRSIIGFPRHIFFALSSALSRSLPFSIPWKGFFSSSKVSVMRKGKASLGSASPNNSNHVCFAYAPQCGQEKAVASIAGLTWRFFIRSELSQAGQHWNEEYVKNCGILTVKPHKATRSLRDLPLTPAPASQ